MGRAQESTGTRPSDTPPSEAIPTAQAPGAAPPVWTAPPASTPPGYGYPPSGAPPQGYDAYLAQQRAYAAWAANGWRPEPERRWYGWQTLLVDGASLGLWIGASVGSSGRSSSGAESALIIGGFFGYLLGAPIVHGAHGHWGKFGASLGFRVGTSAVALIGAAGCVNQGSSNCDGGYNALLIIGSLGIIASIVVDAALIAREDVPPGEQAFTLSPWIAREGLGGGLLLGHAL